MNWVFQKWSMRTVCHRTPMRNVVKTILGLTVTFKCIGTSYSQAIWKTVSEQLEENYKDPVDIRARNPFDSCAVEDWQTFWTRCLVKRIHKLLLCHVEWHIDQYCYCFFNGKGRVVQPTLLRRPGKEYFSWLRIYHPWGPAQWPIFHCWFLPWCSATYRWADTAPSGYYEECWLQIIVLSFSFSGRIGCQLSTNQASSES